MGGETWAGSYNEDGFLHVRGVFEPADVDELDRDLQRLASEWSAEGAWRGPWRREYLDETLVESVEMFVLHDLHFYSAVWARALLHPTLIDVVTALLGPAVELHHTTMHLKPPERGAPFPMHQDHPFYPHADARYVAVLVHLDDTCHENGEIRFLRGSHRAGPVAHIEHEPDGTPCAPYLPVDRYRLEDAHPVPASRGDVVCFNINTVHGSYSNVTDRPRRLVRVGFRHPHNRQFSGQASTRPGIMVAGLRERREGDRPFPEI